MAVLAPLIVIAVWWLATHGKGDVSTRLAVWLSAIIVVWVILAIEVPSVADGMPGAFASGIGQAATGLGKFLAVATRA